jgi:arginine decarboxylase
MIPRKAFVTKGSGVHKDRLASFELALRAAGIEKYNLAGCLKTQTVSTIG